LGTIRLITDGAGTVVGSGSYSPWGIPDSGSVTLGGYGFTGEQFDPETGFVYLRNRYYDPTTGRFLTPDPLGELGSGVNLYAYVGNDPVDGTDPSGLFWGQKWVKHGIQSTGLAKVVTVADAVAIALDTTAVAITDTTTLIGCTAGLAGCGAGYLTGVALAQPLNNVSAEYVGSAGVVIGCINSGPLSSDCLSSVKKQAIGFLIPEPHLDLAWDFYILHGDAEALHSLEGKTNNRVPGPEPTAPQPFTGAGSSGVSQAIPVGMPPSPVACSRDF
jgi:RHS repeat-associated protein